MITVGACVCGGGGGIDIELRRESTSQMSHSLPRSLPKFVSKANLVMKIGANFLHISQVTLP